MMTKLKLNLEYARRHLFVVAVFLSLGSWFMYDGLVAYPKTPAHELYESIEKSKAPEGFDLEGFKKQKIQSQKFFSCFLLFASAVVLFRLWRSYRFDFSFDGDKIRFNGSEMLIADITEVDKTRWEKNSILKLKTKSNTIVLDGWHHNGVAEFVQILSRSGLLSR